MGLHACLRAPRVFAKVLEGKYPAKDHCRRVAEEITAKTLQPSGLIYLEGAKTKMQEDNDEPEPFRQRRNFFYLSGCAMPDCYLTYDIANDHLVLYLPPVNLDEVIWSGMPMSPDEAQRTFDVDQVRYSTEVNPALAHLGVAMSRAPANARGPVPSCVYAIANQVSAETTFLEFDNKDFKLLRDAIERCRVVKDEYEVALIAKANSISAAAHHSVMKRVSEAINETELEAVFLKQCVAVGAKKQAYHSIVASGDAAATLHYVRNDQPLSEGKQNLLLDAGCEWNCYASDITRTFPISGEFTPESRAIYDTVLRMQTECIAMLKEDVQWETVHEHAHRVLIEGLLKQGILCDGSVDEILKQRTSVAFMPHGLGHYLGMDTHDVGGKPNYADPDPLYRYLRVRGKLPAGAVVTVEPGIYFCRFIIERYLEDDEHAKFIDTEVLDRYWNVGGVRIEDNLLITASGSDNLTTAIKDRVEMEVMIGAAW